MENIKANWAKMYDEDGRYNIVLFDEAPVKLRPSSQDEIKNIELVFDGNICTITGDRRKYEYFHFDTPLDDLTKEKIAELFDEKAIKYKKKKIRNWFKTTEGDEIPYVSGWVGLNEYVPIKITTSAWALYDKRIAPVKSEEVPAIMDSANMD